MQRSERETHVKVHWSRLAVGVFFVALLLTSALLLSQNGSSTPPMGYKIF
jgi:hypothetical protein